MEDVMTTPLASGEPATAVREIADLMTNHRWSASSPTMTCTAEWNSRATEAGVAGWNGSFR